MILKDCFLRQIVNTVRTNQSQFFFVIIVLNTFSGVIYDNYDSFDASYKK